MIDNARAKSVYGRRYAMVSGHHLATQAGARVLEAGGSLVDAMVASSAVMLVTLPHTSSLGGCGMMLYFDAATRQVSALNGSGRAPLNALPEHFAQGLPQRGARACVTPTLVRMWARSHRRFGRLPWATLFESAISLAADGVGCSEELDRNLGLVDATIRTQAGFEEAFFPQGERLRRGQLHVQPALARVLWTIASHGEAGFYDGWVAQSLLSFSQLHGGLLQASDFEMARADWVTPWFLAQSGHEVHVMPPNSVGALMLRQLQIQDEAIPAADASVAMVRHILDAHEVIRSCKNRIADPQHHALSLEALALGDVSRAESAAVNEPGDTTGFVAMDSEGNAISMLQSVFQPFGSGCVDPNTGVLLNNRLFDFAMEHDSPNRLRPGARPAHTLNPYLVTSSRQVLLSGASPGGVSQTTTGFQILQSALNRHLSLGEVVSIPRWSLGRDATVFLEPGVSPQVATQLRTQGLSVVENSQHEFYFGSAKVVRRLTGGLLEAAADQRRQASATAD